MFAHFLFTPDVIITQEIPRVKKRTFNLPNYNNGFPLAMGREGLGSGNMPASLPNITGRVYGDGFNGTSAIFWFGDGAFSIAYESVDYIVAQYSSSVARKNRSAIFINANGSKTAYNRDDNVAFSTRNGVYYIIKY